MTIKPEKSPIKHEYPPMSPAKPVIMSVFEEPMKIEPRLFMEPIKNEVMKMECMETVLFKPEAIPAEVMKVEPIEEEPLEDPKLEMDLTSKEVMKPEDYDEPDFGRVEEKFEDTKPFVHIPEPVKEVKEEPKPIIAPKLMTPKLITPKPIVTPKVEEKEQLIAPIPMVEKIVERRKSRIRERIDAYRDETSEDEPLDKVEKIEDKKPQEVKVESKLEDEKIIKEEIAKFACHDRSSRSSRNQPTCVNQDSMDDKTDDSQDKITPKKDKDKRKMVSVCVFLFTLCEIVTQNTTF